MLKTEIYLSQQDIREEEKVAKENKMRAAGWLPLTKEMVDEALRQGKNLQVNAISENDWLTIKVDKVFKSHIFGDGQYGLMKPRARTHGYALYQFDDAFCRLV